MSRAPAPTSTSERIGVLDWGIGGFGVVREILRRAPGQPILYFSDAGTTPYGLVPAPALATRLAAVGAWFAAEGVTRLVVACNAASSVVARTRFPSGLEVLDVIGPGVDAVRAAGVPRVGLVGGRRTVRSGVHRRLLALSRIHVHARVAQPLSALIEAGDHDSVELRATLASIVTPLRDETALLLACTHYPAITERFREALPRTLLLDPAPRLAAGLVGARVRVAAPSGARIEALTSGDPKAMVRAARLAFGLEPARVGRVTIRTPFSN